MGCVVETVEKLKNQIEGNTVVLYMNGTPQFPMCGFSSHVAQILNQLKTKYAFVNVLENPDIRAELPKYANWPTFPQLFVKGELIGGSDILTELHESGELQNLIDSVEQKS